MSGQDLPASFLEVVEDVQNHSKFERPMAWAIAWLNPPGGGAVEWLIINSQMQNTKSFAAWLATWQQSRVGYGVPALSTILRQASGGLRLSNTNVNWFLNTCRDLVPLATGESHKNIQAALRMHNLLTVQPDAIFALVAIFGDDAGWSVPSPGWQQMRPMAAMLVAQMQNE